VDAVQGASDRSSASVSETVVCEHISRRHTLVTYPTAAR
jgi:hypothetical protein